MPPHAIHRCHLPGVNIPGNVLEGPRPALAVAAGAFAALRELRRSAPSHYGFSRSAAPCSELFAMILPDGYPKGLCYAVNLDLMGLAANIDCMFWHVI